jgi:glycerol-3-phosphate O-acyltransferase
VNVDGLTCYIPWRSMLDDIAQAVLAREEVVKYLRNGGERRDDARDRIHAYLDELQTKQRYPIYRALQHPLYPILRKIERKHENLHHVAAATGAHRIIYASNHKSHTDYLVEPLVLDDNGIRPPLIAAGINLFGGPLGLLHRHVTGAIPIRRNTKDPAYLVTLKAYVAEIIKKHDLLFYPEGGRSYSGELKPTRIGLIGAALTAERRDLVIIPTAIAYDLVLEDHVLARQRVKKRQRPFTRELAEMVRYAVGYRSRAFVTFGAPMPVGDVDPQSRGDLLALTRQIRARIGALYKVLPTALFAAAMRPSITRRDLESRIDQLIEELAVKRANLGVTSGREAVEEAAEPLETRGIVVLERGRFRVRDRSVLRYYARTIEHLLVTTGRPH